MNLTWSLGKVKKILKLRSTLVHMDEENSMNHPTKYSVAPDNFTLLWFGVIVNVKSAFFQTKKQKEDAWL